jgi:hypothetical protein
MQDPLRLTLTGGYSRRICRWVNQLPSELPGTSMASVQ